jgi:hypothetical protein
MAKPSEVTQFKIMNRSPYLSTWHHWDTPVVRPPWIIWWDLRIIAIRRTIRC